MSVVVITTLQTLLRFCAPPGGRLGWCMSCCLIGITPDRIVLRLSNILVPVKRPIPIGGFCAPELQAWVIESPQIILGRPIPGAGLPFQLLQGCRKVFGLISEV